MNVDNFLYIGKIWNHLKNRLLFILGFCLPIVVELGFLTISKEIFYYENKMDKLFRQQNCL